MFNILVVSFYDNLRLISTWSLSNFRKSFTYHESTVFELTVKISWS